MKFINKNLFFVLSILISTLFITSCKRTIVVEVQEIWGRAVKVIGTEKSNFSTFARIINRTPAIEAKIEEWSFKLFSGNTLLFEVNNNNYESFSYNVMVSKPVNYVNGTMAIMMGLPYYDAYVDYVDEDIFQGKKPDKLEFTCTIHDTSGNNTELSATNTLEYLEKEE